MNIDRLTITGADNSVDIENLVWLSKWYSFVEWGILFSKGRRGTARYPSLMWIDVLMQQGGMNLSAHLCGEYAREVMEQSKFDVFDLYNGFARFQINYNFEKSTGWDLVALVWWAEEHPNTSIILQWNKANGPYLKDMTDIKYPPNIHILYDSSGGRGREISNIEAPFKTYTGYSGGISPDNIKSVLNLINNYPAKESVWIDMESGVRANDVFDLKKVQLILEAVKH
jgi:phosphoribosylanthranilate isomerase